MFNTKLPHFRQRIAIMLLGNFLMGFYMSLLIEINQGTDPFTCFFLGLSSKLPISYGTTVALGNCIMILFSFWRKREIISFGTVVNMFGFGYTCDFFRWVWHRTFSEEFFAHPAVKWGLLWVLLLCQIISAAAYMASDTGESPYDALPFIIVDAFPKIPFTAARMALDILCVVCGFLLGSTVGIVTAVMAFGIAPIMKIVRMYIEKKLE